MSCRTRMEGPELEVAPCVYEYVSDFFRPLDRTPSHSRSSSAAALPVSRECRSARTWQHSSWT